MTIKADRESAHRNRLREVVCDAFNEETVRGLSGCPDAALVFGFSSGQAFHPNKDAIWEIATDGVDKTMSDLDSSVQITRSSKHLENTGA
ncbi:MAG TPA: hypothetical protein VGF01_03735 [Terracidiphilus sp.]|jgi:hypothetical protein